MIVNNKLQLKQWIFNAFRLECFSIDEKSRRLILSGCGLFSVRTSKFHKQIVFLVVFSGHSQLNNSIEELRSRRICYQSLSTLWINSQMWTSNSLFRPRRLLWFVLCMFLFCPTQCWNDFSYRAANCIQSESNGFAILWHSVPLFSIGIICMISDESHMRRNVLKWNETRLVCVAFCIFVCNLNCRTFFSFPILFLWRVRWLTRYICYLNKSRKARNNFEIHWN